MKAPAQAFLLLAAATALAGLYRISGLGFYNDDYFLLASFARADARGMVSGLYAAFGPAILSRPLDLLFFPLLYRLFGASPLPYHLLANVFVLAAGWCAYRLLRDLEADHWTALLAGLLAVLYPNHDATRNWISGLHASLSLAGFLYAMRLHLGWLRTGSKTRLFAGLGVLCASALLYEAAVFLPLALAALDLRSPREALRRHWPLLAAVFAVLLYQRVLTWLSLGPPRNQLSVDPVHALKALAAGFECTFLNRLLHLLWRSARYAGTAFRAADWTLWAVSSAALLGLCRAEQEEPGSPPLRMLWLGLAIVILGYVPYLFAAGTGYAPTVFSENNRLNLPSSIGGALVFAWCLRRLRCWVLPGLLACAFLLACWASNAQWAQAYSLQQEILRAVGPHLERTGPKTLLAFGFPNSVGSATVFQSTYDLDGALFLRYRKPGLKGLVGEGRVRFEDREAVLTWFGESRIPYEKLCAYRHSDGTFREIRSRQDGEAFLASAG